MAPDTKEVIHMPGQPLKISLQRTADSTYSWQIMLSGSSMDDILPAIKKVDDRLRAQYGGKK